LFFVEFHKTAENSRC